ncbi:MAG: hypothetical protein ABR964_10900 [Tepidisphaeraceae bacterium]|jgi:hypothetical protein
MKADPMGFFSFRRRSKAVAPSARLPVVRQIRALPKEELPTPQGLRQKLFDAATAAAAGDEDPLACLCQLHEKSIFEQGLIWSQVPPEIRANPALLRWYGNGLQTIAQFCADRLGKPELMDKLKKLELQLPPEGPDGPDDANA